MQEIIKYAWIVHTSTSAMRSYIMHGHVEMLDISKYAYGINWQNWSWSGKVQERYWRHIEQMIFFKNVLYFTISAKGRENRRTFDKCGREISIYSYSQIIKTIDFQKNLHRRRRTYKKWHAISHVKFYVKFKHFTC